MSDSFFQQFEQFSRRQDPSWLAALREKAIQNFQKQGWPTTETEDWRYTSLQPLQKVPFVLPHQDEAGGRIESDFVGRSAFYQQHDIRLVFVNGFYSPDLSFLKALPAGVEIGPLSHFLGKKNMEGWIDQIADADQERPLVSLNTAFLQEGLFLSIPAGVVVEKPIYFCHLVKTTNAPTALHPRNLVRVGEGSQVTLIELYLGDGDETYLTNAVTEVWAEPSSVVDHYKLQHESGKAFHLGSLDIRQGAKSRFSSHVISLGATLCRNEVRTRLAAEGSECQLNGLYMVTGRQHVDNQTTIDHAKPRGTSSELYKGILSGQSTGVFNGRIVVRPGAEKTSARQTNKNLLLSTEALMNTKPLLEIFTNDVKCNHGATLGRLDENQIFYLRSRGLSKVHAQSLLTYAFANEVISKIRLSALQSALEKWIFRRLLVSELSGEVL